MFSNRCGWFVWCALALGAVQSLPARAQNESTKGSWEPQVEVNLQAIHSILMKNGKVLCLDFQFRNPNTIIIDPADPQNPVVPQQMIQNFFCAAHAQLSDGRILFAGGGYGGATRHQFAAIFDPGADPQAAWTAVDDIAAPGERRWYATATTLGSGKVLLTAGRESAGTDVLQDEDVPVVFNPWASAGQQWKRPNPDLLARKVTHWYPFMFQVSDGKVVMAGGAYFSTDQPTRPPEIHLDSYKYNVALEAWDTYAVARSTYPGMTAVMYRPDKVMKAGRNRLDPIDDTAKTVQTIALADTDGDWTAYPNMKKARQNFYLIALPDGRVLAVGGTFILEAEWTDPEEQPAQWQLLAAMAEQRQYHSSAVLLPDARVMIGGGQAGGRQTTVQFFKPPYLYDSNDQEIQPPVRPLIDSAPSVIEYGKAFDVDTAQADDVVKVSLIRLGSATHSFDQDQRFLPLEFVILSGQNQVRVSAPAQWNIAPRGHYMLFILTDGDRAGIYYPSVAKIVQLIPPPNE